MKNKYFITLIIIFIGIGVFSIKTSEALTRNYANRFSPTPTTRYINTSNATRRIQPYVIIGNSRIFRPPLRSERILR